MNSEDARNEYAPTESQWADTDWSLPNVVIANRLGCHESRVALARKRYAPKKEETNADI